MSIDAEKKESGVPQEEFLYTFSRQVAVFREARKNEPLLLLVPMNSLIPSHWSLLVLERQRKTVFPYNQTEEEAALAEKDRWIIRYYDSKATISVDMYSRIHQAVKLVSLAFKLKKAMEWAPADEEADNTLQEYQECYGSIGGEPGTVKYANVPRQTDGWSCGLWTLIYAEKELREWLGEEPRAIRKVSKDFVVEIANYNKVLQHMIGFLARTKKKREMEKAAQALKKAHDEQVKAAAEKSEPSEKALAGLPKPGEIVTGSQKAGCSRCSYHEVGCLSCVGWKAARYFRVKEAAQASSKEEGKKSVTADGDTAKGSQAADPKADN